MMNGWTSGWDWVWMSVMMTLSIVALGVVVYVAIRASRRDG